MFLHANDALLSIKQKSFKNRIVTTSQSPSSTTTIIESSEKAHPTTKFNHVMKKNQNKPRIVALQKKLERNRNKHNQKQLFKTHQSQQETLNLNQSYRW